MLNCALCGNSVAGRQFSCLSAAAENGSSVWNYFITTFSGTYRASNLCCSFDAQSRWLLLTSHLACLLSVPNLALILLLDPESRASNKGNPGSRKTYWGPSL